MSTIIIGAGIIGLSIAYYLSEDSSKTPPSSIHLVESSSELFASASGYAGGFLARDWFSPSSRSLGALSFGLHKQLAETHGGHQWGYHKTTTVSLAQTSSLQDDEWLREGRSRAEIAPETEAPGSGLRPAWLKKAHHLGLDQIGDIDSTAQVNPLRLCQFLLRQCQARGVHLHVSTSPSSVNMSHSGKIDSVILQSENNASLTSIPCAHLILAAGAWTPRVYRTLFPESPIRIPVGSLAGHSLVLRVPGWEHGDEYSPSNGAHAIYTTEESDYSPEIFARADGEVYIAGVNDARLPLPDKPTDRKVDDRSIQRLRATAEKLLGQEVSERETNKIEVVREGLCWRPVTAKGVPIIAKVNDGIWTAVGHGPWGISLSLGTGKVVSEMVEGRNTSADISRLGF